MPKSANIRLVDNPDLNDISAFMLQEWPRPCWDYSPEVLESYLGGPESDPELYIALYQEEAPRGFQVMKPCTLAHKGKLFPSVVRSFWTTCKGKAGFGVSVTIQKELLNRAEKKGIAGAYNVCEVGSVADRSFQVSLQMRHFKKTCFKLNTVGIWIASPVRLRSRLQALEPGPPAGGRLYEPSDAPACAEFLNGHADGMDLLMWSTPEIVDFRFRLRHGARTWLATSPEGKIMGILSCRQQRILTRKDSHAIVLCETCFLDNLTDGQRNAFLTMILEDPLWDGVEALCVNQTGTVSDETLRTLGFTRSSRSYNLYFQFFTEDFALRTGSHFFLDIY